MAQRSPCHSRRGSCESSVCISHGLNNLLCRSCWRIWSSGLYGRTLAPGSHPFSSSRQSATQIFSVEHAKPHCSLQARIQKTWKTSILNLIIGTAGLSRQQLLALQSNPINVELKWFYRLFCLPRNYGAGRFAGMEKEVFKIGPSARLNPFCCNDPRTLIVVFVSWKRQLVVTVSFCKQQRLTMI